jgi:hypothetical protein
MRKRLPSLNAVRTFKAAARHGRFEHVAAGFHVSHSAVNPGFPTLPLKRNAARDSQIPARIA